MPVGRHDTGQAVAVEDRARHLGAHGDPHPGALACDAEGEDKRGRVDARLVRSVNAPDDRRV